MPKRIAILLMALALTVVAAAPIAAAASGAPGGFEHAPAIDVDGDPYFLAGAPDGPNGQSDIPGHYWRQAGKNQLVGKHFNIGPFGAERWWSSDAPDGELLYVVRGIIDIWTEDRQLPMQSAGTCTTTSCFPPLTTLCIQPRSSG